VETANVERSRGDDRAGGETPSLDFKRELGAKNADIAKDIAAMTVNGGVLIYGVGEDKQTRVATAIVPQPLNGVEERFGRSPAPGSRRRPTSLSTPSQRAKQMPKA
jgi:hypothetical protein